MNKGTYDDKKSPGLGLLVKLFYFAFVPRVILFFFFITNWQNKH